MTDKLLMGRVGAARGIKGEVRIHSFAEDPLALVDYAIFETNRPDLRIEIEAARAAANVLVARLKGVHDRTAAEKLNGVELYMARDRLPPVDSADEFYHADLLGLEARAPDGARLGTVVAVPNYGAGDLLEIAGEGGATQLFAFTKAVVPVVRLAEGYLIVEPPAEIEAEPDAL